MPCDSVFWQTLNGKSNISKEQGQMFVLMFNKLLLKRKKKTKKKTRNKTLFPMTNKMT